VACSTSSTRSAAAFARACDGGIYLHALMTTALQQKTAVKAIAEQYSQVESAYFAAPNPGYGIAMEGAIKRF
jgi:glucosamine 6-phosphate synthetase-like amidotransferase/phosphosugar isomerase protein